MPDAANIISLSLVSHTNVGKTTLARTLLSQSVGEVRDEPHVTDTNDRFELAQTPQGDQLVLWDTPGFGDSARLARRLVQSDRPIGWFVSQVWDRFADRALWSSQQAVHNVREEADVVLYLVNAAENPEDAGYVEPEMKILAWIGKPIIVLLNQMGPPAGHQAEEAEIDRWRSYLTRFGNVHQVLALDAFARCWVQEGALLQAVEPLLLQAKKPAFGRLNRLWQNQRRQTFDRSMHILATRLAATALDRERIPNSSLKDQLREVGKVLGVSRSPQDDAKQQAMAKLAERLNTAIRQSTDELIEANGLVGHATDEVLSRMADHYDVTENLNEGHAAVVGGLVTGALAGLKADLLAGGLTLGGGMIAGGVLGALGGAGLARGYNMVRGIDAITVTWTDAVMNRLIQSALLTYLAVAHYGRGRGEWAQSEHRPLGKDRHRRAGTAARAVHPVLAQAPELWSGRPGQRPADRTDPGHGADPDPPLPQRAVDGGPGQRRPAPEHRPGRRPGRSAGGSAPALSAGRRRTRVRRAPARRLCRRPRSGVAATPRSVLSRPIARGHPGHAGRG